MPGATTAMVVSWRMLIASNECMMPHTVPKRPMNGAVEPTVARNPSPRSSRTVSRETVRLERGLGFLATVGSTAPFIGLFGTVWGIMHSFEAISMRQDTTIAVVAPGIAEALFATALGLLAAIPAVVAYNRFVNELSRYTARLDTFSDELSAFLSRQLDEKTRA